MKRASILIPFLIVSTFLFAQKQQTNERIDSLVGLLKKAKEDTNKVILLNELSFSYSTFKAVEGIKFAEQALTLAQKLEWQRGIAKSNNLLGINCIYRSDYKASLSYLMTASQIYNEIGDSVCIAKCYNNIGVVHRSTGDYSEALKYFNNALLLSKRIGYKVGASASYSSIGSVNYFQGNYDTAQRNYLNSLDLDIAIGDKKGQAGCYGNIGNVFSAEGNYIEAVKNFYKSLKIEEEINDKPGLINCYTNIGITNNIQGNYDEALKCQYAALKIAEEIGDKSSVGSCYNSIGNVYNAQHNLPAALKNYLAALKIREEKGEKKGIAVGYYNVATVLYNQDSSTEALKNYFIASKMFEAIGNKSQLASCYSYIGAVYGKQGKYSEADTFCNKGLKLGKEIGALEPVRIANENLSAIYAHEERYREALEAYKEFVSVNDSLFNRENAKKILQIQMQYDFDKKEDSLKLDAEKKELSLQKEIQLKALKYEYEKKQQAAKTKEERQRLEYEHDLNVKQINYEYAQKMSSDQDKHEKEMAVAAERTQKEILLNQKQKYINRKQKQIGAIAVIALVIISCLVFYIYWKRKNYLFKNEISEVEREVISSQLDTHFIRNAIDSINGFIVENDSESASEYLLKFDRLVSRVLSNLTEKLVTLKDDLNLLEDYFQVVKLRFLSVKIGYKTVIDTEIDPGTTLVPPMVFQILMENSIKHGLKERGGEIIISVQRNEDAVNCAVEDNGIGREAARAIEGNQRPSYGSNLAERLIKTWNDVGGKTSFKVIDLTDSAGNARGTRVEFTFPFHSNA